MTVAQADIQRMKVKWNIMMLDTYKAHYTKPKTSIRVIKTLPV